VLVLWHLWYLPRHVAAAALLLPRVLLVVWPLRYVMHLVHGSAMMQWGQCHTAALLCSMLLPKKHAHAAAMLQRGRVCSHRGSLIRVGALYFQIDTF
jgi:hypothetical protein